MQAEQGGRAAVAAVAAQQGGEAGEQAALLLVQQAAEQRDGGRQAAVGLSGSGQRGQRRGACRLDPAGGDLALATGRVGRAVERAALHAGTGDVAVAGEPGEGVDGADAEQCIEFGRAEAAGGGVDQGAGGGAQGAAGGEADAVVGPQAGGVEAGALAEGVEAPAVGVAGEVAELLELAEDRAGGRLAERGGEVGQGGDDVAAQEVGERVGGEDRGAHEAIMT